MLERVSDRIGRAFEAGLIVAKRVQKSHLFIAFGLFISLFVLTRLIHNADDLSPNPGLEGKRPGQGKPAIGLNPNIHPIETLIASAQQEFSVVQRRQSRNLAEAVREYRRRYKLHPPPNFDKWFEFAKENEVQLIDEYDGIHDALLPFWGLSPRAIRTRAKKALGADDFLIGIFIRDGRIVKVERGPEWKHAGSAGVMDVFAQYLPDMDIVYNLHDECRVILPHEDLSRLLDIARKRTVAHASANKAPRNGWSERPGDVNAGTVEENSISPFNEYAHQFTWTISRLSCPPNSPAREMSYDDDIVPDQRTAYAFGDLEFVSNRTALTDICLSPSLKDVWGFFNRPNSWTVTHELVPIFSPSKISSFQDILVPAPWYLSDKVFRNNTLDLPWGEKRNTLYWRGTTTSGYSGQGSWHRQNRQLLVERIEKSRSAMILENADRTGWSPREVLREQYRDMFDVHFTFIGQCAPEDCDEQRAYFDMREDESYQLNWRNKYLLDLDGNAFSGRFYTFLQSRSLTFKQAMFREWHDERVQPWVHYVPLSVEGKEHLEAVRYFDKEEEGKTAAEKMVRDSTVWADKALRKVDMQAYLFRLMLEYGRLVDDNRDEIGFTLP